MILVGIGSIICIVLKSWNSSWFNAALSETFSHSSGGTCVPMRLRLFGSLTASYAACCCYRWSVVLAMGARRCYATANDDVLHSPPRRCGVRCVYVVMFGGVG
jgi:hypothetical protein